MNFIRIVLFASLLLLPQLAHAAAPVAGIRVEGNQRIETSTILSYVTIKQGEVVDDAMLSQSLKALFASGLFADASLRQDGNNLIVTVKENPIINRIAFEGNDKLKSEDLQNEISLRERTVFTRAKVQNDVERVLELYRRTGRFAATVEPKIIELDQNRVDLVFEIAEGEATEIKRVAFIGNKAFNSSKLREELITRETAWYNILSSDDIYDPDRIEADKDQLRRFYNKSGYADFEVVSASSELTPDKQGFFITYTIKEGPRYKIGKVEMESKYADLNASQFKPAMLTNTGEWYNSEKVKDSIDILTKQVDQTKYPFVESDAKLKVNKDSKTVDLIYVLAEGPKQYVERININGNARTQDRVIRREMKLAEGDALNRQNLKKSEKSIKDLDYFGKMDIKTKPGAADDRKIVDVNVEEKSTGELSVGGGFSTTDGALADFSIRERNLLGRGQDLRVAATVAQRRQNYNISFTEPKLFDQNLAGGIDLFNTRTDLTQQSAFIQEQFGGGLRIAYPLSERVNQSWGYKLYNDKVSDVKDNASRFIREQEGERVVSQISQGLTYDTRDSRIDPTEGHVLSWNAEIAGLGGDVNFVRNRVTGTKYFPIADNWTLMTLAEVGNVFSWGDNDNVLINNRFFIGGDTLRGFRVAGIGPRDLATDDALGGKTYLRGTIEQSVPLGLPQDLGIKGYIFSDAGTLFNSGVDDPNVDDNAQLRLSAGAGISWRSPFGPIRVDLAKPILKENSDETQLFRFSFGTRF